MKVNARLGKALGEKCWSIITRIAYACMAKEFDNAVSELASASIQPTFGCFTSPMLTIEQTNYLRVHVSVICILT